MRVLSFIGSPVDPCLLADEVLGIFLWCTGHKNQINQVQKKLFITNFVVGLLLLQVWIDCSLSELCIDFSLFANSCKIERKVKVVYCIMHNTCIKWTMIQTQFALCWNVACLLWYDRLLFIQHFCIAHCLLCTGHILLRTAFTILCSLMCNMLCIMQIVPLCKILNNLHQHYWTWNRTHEIYSLRTSQVCRPIVCKRERSYW